MILTGSQMEELVTLINEVIERSTLGRLVKFRLDQDVDDIVKGEVKKIDAVFQVIDWAIRRQKAAALLDGVAKEFPGIAQALVKIVEEARLAEIVTPAAAPAVAAAAADPLAPYFPQDVPFVDRQDLTQRLNLLWTCRPSGVLVIRGERYSGRSYSWLRIVDVASGAGVVTCKVDVSRDPGTWKVANFVDRVATLLRVDRLRLKDSLAQGSTQSGALVNALVDRFAGRAANAERWCIVFDGLDRPGVEPAIIELVEDLIAEVLATNIPGLSIIILGYGEHSLQTFRHLILTEKINWIEEKELCIWLNSVVRAAGKVAQPSDVSVTAASILEGRTPPFDAEAMDKMRDRVKTEAVALLRRLS